MVFLLTYDISDNKRLQRVASICEEYLIRIQKSVFYGELTGAALHTLLDKLKAVIDPENDSIYVFTIPLAAVKKRKILGKKPQDPYVIL